MVSGKLKGHSVYQKVIDSNLCVNRYQCKKKTESTSADSSLG